MFLSFPLLAWHFHSFIFFFRRLGFCRDCFLHIMAAVLTCSVL